MKCSRRRIDRAPITDNYMTKCSRSQSATLHNIKSKQPKRFSTKGLPSPYMETRNRLNEFSPSTSCRESFQIANGNASNSRPEKKLHAFFESLKIPYRVFETDSVTRFSDTMDIIDKQHTQTLIVEELIPQQSKTAIFLWTAMSGMSLLLMAQLYSVWGIRKAQL